MKIATWNVNSIKARLPVALDWLGTFKPDVVLVQETKTRNEGFPYMEIEDLGYNIAVHGQKSYNGVAILSRFPIEDVVTHLPGDTDDPDCRYIEAVTNCVRVVNVYVPNGRGLDDPHFDYKLRFFDRLRIHLQDLLQFEESLVLGGDFNVTPTAHDVLGGAARDGRLHCSLPERLALRSLTNLGLIDAVRQYHPVDSPAGTALYSWWGYKGNAWQQNDGMRIDMLYLSPQAADRLQDAGIDLQQRALPKASDHAPVWCVLQ